MGCTRTLFPASIARVLSSPDDANHNAVDAGQRIETVTSPMQGRDTLPYANPEKMATIRPAIIISIASRESPRQSASDPLSEALVVTPFFLPADKGNRYPPHLFVAQRRLVGRKFRIRDAARTVAHGY